MNNLTKFYNNSITNFDENLYLYFSLGESKYAIKVEQVVEIMKLPLLDYPQKLSNNAIGLLNYNNYTINILDLRFYLDIKVTPYSESNQLLIVKTDEAIFGLIIDKVENIIALEQSKIEPFQFSGEERIIRFLYSTENETISVISLTSLQETLKKGVAQTDVDIPALFPSDDNSKRKLIQRNQALAEKFQQNIATSMFSQHKFISFELNESIYCINLEYVKEFLKNTAITRIPCNLDYIKGVITFRGDFVTVIDIKKFLHIDESNSEQEETKDKNSIIIIETPDHKIGFAVDKIFDIIGISEELISDNLTKQNKFILSEVSLNNKFYTILDMKNILSDDRFFIDDNG